MYMCGKEGRAFASSAKCCNGSISGRVKSEKPGYHSPFKD